MEREILCRTSGDGMENEDFTKAITADVVQTKATIISNNTNEKPAIPEKKNSCKVPGQYIIYRPNSESQSLPPVIPKGKLYCLIPRLIKDETPQSSTFKKVREPRFVPIEPYKAAVNPIFPLKKQNKLMNKKKNNRNNLDINFLVSQMSNMKTSELNSSMSRKQNHASSIENDGTAAVASVNDDVIDEEKQNLFKENQELKRDKDHLNGQLKFQLQVNAELKNLLVASVGEDLQTRVNVLTEDKLQLARALLDTANNLSTHTEQIEFLAGQCEVWRSKFLASSVMIEELARWKADLSQKNSTLMESNRRTLQLISKLREMQIDILKNLRFLANIKTLNLRASDVVSLTSECVNISQQMILHSGIGMPENLNLNNLNVLTETEMFAAKALQNLSQKLTETDKASKAIVGQAFYSSRSKTIRDTAAAVALDKNNALQQQNLG